MDPAKPAGLGQTRTLPAHLRYAVLQAELPEPEQKTPSLLMAELKGTVRQPVALKRPEMIEILNMSEYTHNTDSIVPLDEPLFQPSPPEVVFESFEPLAKYTAVLHMRNNDTVQRRIKILAPDSSVFTVEPPKALKGAGGGKVAPGMEVIFKVHFSPRANTDYHCQLMCVTEREKFAVGVSARGPRPCFDFPDGVDFGLQPVRARAEEAFLLRNSGLCEGRFSLEVMPPFAVTPCDGRLGAGQSVQLLFSFDPELAGEYSEELAISYDTGERCYARLEGAAAEVDVTLERSLQILDPCYISLISQRTLKLHNRSDIRVSFDWKKLAGEQAEHAHRMERSLQLLSEAAEETHALRVQRRIAEEDPLVFEDEIFAIEPLSGEIFPGCSCEVTVVFRPNLAGEASTTAYCAVNGRQERLALRLQGMGLGPKATWLYDTLDIGDIFVNSRHRYEVALENHGEIGADYTLVKNNSLFASKFSFSPSEGHLEPKEMVNIEVRFLSDALGEFSETFVAQLFGQPAPLPMLIKGRVVGPSFLFQQTGGGEPVEVLDFKTVSIGFLNTITFELQNTSEIPMRYALRIPGDTANAFQPREFQVVPASGAVLPHGKQKLQLDFISYTVKKYDLAMLVDVEAVGPELLALPIVGECVVPKIVTDTPTVDYGESFLGHAYPATVVVKNTSFLPVKIEIVPQDEASQTIGVYTVEPLTGIIQPHDTLTLEIKFTCVRLGPMSLPMYVRVVGMTEPSLTVELMAEAVGPNVTLTTAVVDWGKTPVLQDATRTLALFNDSLIPATYHAMTRKAPPNTSFAIAVPTETLAPGETREIDISVFLDDTVRVSEELILQIKDSPERTLTLTATGTGSTIVGTVGDATVTSDLATLDFGDHYSNRLCQMEVTLENRGRKPQTLTWANTSVPPPRAKKPGEKDDGPAEQNTIFAITPEKVLMEPRAVCTFTIRGLSNAAGVMSETLQCTATIPKAKKPITIFEPTVTATFIEPLIEPSLPAVDFTYLYEDGVPISDQSAPLTLTNVSPLPLTLSVACGQPFSLDVREAALEPNEAVTLHVTFHPSFLGDKQSGTHESKLQISYREHPQKDSVRLSGELCFPNLVFDISKADLGVALNDTPNSMSFTIFNPSRVEAVWSWAFATQDVDTPRLFDVLPIRGSLPPGGSEACEVLFKGGINAKAKALALCEVSGGPEYELPMQAESSGVQYKLSTNAIDFGLQEYHRVEEKELFVHNHGKVPVGFSVLKAALSRSNVLEVLPASGRISAGDKQRLLVRLLPGMPTKLREVFHVQVAHFEPEEVVVTAEGVYPRIAINLPREETDTFKVYVKQAADAIAKQKADIEAFNQQMQATLAAASMGSASPLLEAPQLLEEMRSRAERTLELFNEADRLSEGQIDRPAMMKLIATGLGLKAQRRDIDMVVDLLDPLGTGFVAVSELQQQLSSTVPMDMGGTLAAPPRPGSAGRSVSGSIRPSEAMTRPGGAASVSGSIRPSEAMTATTRPTEGGRPNGGGGGRRGKKGEDGAAARQQAEIDAEAERLSLCAYCRTQLDEHAAAMDEELRLREVDRAEERAMRQSMRGEEGGDGESPPPGTRSGSARSSRIGSASRRAPLLEPLPPPAPDFSLASYLLDFGNVVKGSTKKKTFRVRNVGWQAISFDLDKNALLSGGFRIEPDKVVRLPGLPESESVDFAVTFASKSGKVGLGEFVFRAKLDMKAGPPIVMVMRANITLPELQLSADTLDFGNVQLGMTRSMTLSVYNPKEIPAEWAVKRPLEQAKDWNFFVCEPAQGTLAPGARVQVQATFTPTSERAYTVKIPFKLNNNPRSFAFTVKGVGKELYLRLEPTSLTLPPCMPHADVVTMDFAIVNPTDYPLEVYSTEFDDRFLPEEDILRNAEYPLNAAGAPSDVLVLPPRAPAEPLWEELVTAHEQRLAAEAAAASAEAAEAAAEAAAEGEEGAEGAPDKDAMAATAGEEFVGEVDEPAAPPADRLLIALVGAPLAGVPAQAALLGGAFGLPVLHAEDVLGPLAAQAADLAAQAAEEAAEAEGADEPAEPPPPPPVEPLEAEAMKEAFAAAMSKEAAPLGYVLALPELPLAYATLPAIAAAMGAARAANTAESEDAQAPWLVALDVSEEAMGARAAAEREAAEAEDPPPEKPADLSEVEYEALSAEAVATFEGKRAAYRRAYRLWEARRVALGEKFEARFQDLQLGLEQWETIKPEVLTALDEGAAEPPPPPDPKGGKGAPPPAKGGKPATPPAAEAAPAAEEEEELDPDAAPERKPGQYTFDASGESADETFEALLCPVLPEIPPKEPPPPPPPEVPPPVTMQMVRRPRQRNAPPLPKGFEIWTLPTPPKPPEAEGEGEAGAEGEEGEEGAAPPAEPAPPAEAEGEGEEQPPGEPTKQCRWLLPPRSSIPCQVQFASERLGRYPQALHFEIMGFGTDKQYTLGVEALCTQPSITKDYRNVFGRKLKARDPLATKKAFIISRSTFEFGPQLVGRPQPKAREDGSMERPHADHCELLHMTNNSVFPLTVHFSFLHGGAGIHSHIELPYELPPPPPLAEGEEEAPPEKPAPPERPQTGDTIFFLGQASMELQPEETQDLLLSAFPDFNGLFEEQLVCTVADNPQPVMFPLSAIGSTPALVVDSEKIVFERLLLRRSDYKQLTLYSRSAMPLRWAIRAEDLVEVTTGGEERDPGKEDFTLAPVSGLLPPGQQETIRVGFHAMASKELARSFTIEVFDAAEPPVLGVVHTIAVELQAEAYSIDVDVKWPQEEVEGLDFGAFKVVDEQASSLDLFNNGKYDVGFKIIARKRPTRDILTFEPSEGVLAPGGGTQQLAVTLKTPEELTLINNMDVRVQFTEILTGEVMVDLNMPIKISCHAVFSKYSIVPNHGLNFGPMVYGSERSRTFEISNTGEFEFRYLLYPQGEAPDPHPFAKTDAAPAADAKGGKGGGGKAAPPEGGTLTVGRFNVGPQAGLVEPGGAVTLSIGFKAGQEAEPFAHTISIDIADRDPAIVPQDYELLAESCIPGIQTTDFNNIFEEQAVMPHIDLSAGMPKNVYSEEENRFFFGSHMVAQEVAERFKITNPFKVPCTITLECKPRAPKAGGGKGAEPAKGGVADAPLAFDVEPKKCVIPPHEHRYVTCYFTPKAMQTFDGAFEIQVEQGTVAETKQLLFDLVGEGTLPHVNIMQPTLRSEVSGAPLLQFPKLLLERSAKLPLLLRNEGILPATVRVTMPKGTPFSCPGSGHLISLEPRSSHTLEVHFAPKAAGDAEASMSLSVLKNSFEDQTVELKGLGYAQDVAIEDLPDADGDENDELHFGDVAPGASKTITFTLRNLSEVARKFTWKGIDGLTFSPSVGHLQPRSGKPITATYAPSEVALHEGSPVALELVRIAYTADAYDWDDSMKVVKYLTEEEFLEREARLKAEQEAAEAAAKAAAEAEAAAAAEAEAAKGGKKGKDDKKGKKEEPPPPEPEAEAEAPAPEEAEPEAPLSPQTPGSPSRRRKVVDTEPEPEYEVVAPPTAEEGAEPPPAEPPMTLLVSARCENGALECEAMQLSFRPTMMFQTRSHSFELKNVGAVEMAVAWVVQRLGGEPLGAAADEPFSVAPAEQLIKAGESMTVTVSFSPQEVDGFTRELVCLCSNLAEGVSPPRVTLSGKSKRPYCHFELTDGGYLREGRRSPEMPGPDGSLTPLDPATRVIEFESLGTKVRNTRRFFVVNPTSVPYDFVWESEAEKAQSADSLVSRVFRCQTRKGTVLAGRKFEMIFEFTPDTVNLQESFWRFRIPSLQIDVPFLLVGAILEPSVDLDRTRHNFGPLLLGQRARETMSLVNKEHLPFAFSFDRASFAGGPIGEGGPSVVDVSPLSGVVGPDSELPIELSFGPTIEKLFNFNVVLHVKNKPTPLVLNVKGEGYQIHDTLQLEDANGRPVELSSFTTTRVDFGEVHINDKVVRQLTIVNSGRFNFDVALNLKTPPGARAPPVTVMPELVTVRKNERAEVQIVYQPMSDAPLPAGLQLRAAITNGRTYDMALLGRGKRPRLSFSFNAHDFGPCFVVTPKNGMAPQTATLRLANDDEHEVYFDLPFTATPFLSVVADRTVLAPGEHAEVLLTFTPPAVESYETSVPFVVNGLWSVEVRVRGEGCDLRLELADPQQQQLNLGAVPVYQQVGKQVNLINRSKRAVDVSLLDAAAALAPRQIGLSFGGGALEAQLRPRETRPLEVRFAPSARIRPFSEPVVLKVCDLPRPMLVVAGACVAMDLQLEMEQVAFGQTVLNADLTRRLMLQNKGDMASTFRMDPNAFKPDFSVTPVTGFLQPNEDVNIEITFHPAALSRDIRYERIPIVVDGQPPLHLTLTGQCVQATAEEKVLSFKTKVREPSTQSVPIKNTSQNMWRIMPVMSDADKWSGAETLEVAAGQTANYDVVYCPMVMTAEGEAGPEKHVGTVFFPLPDGSAILHNLEGVAEPPDAAGTVSESVPCKKAHVLQLSVKNWLKTPQRFRVDIRAPDKDASTQLTGHAYVDVPASLTREYALTFYAYKEGATAAEVHFVNEKTGEFLFYKVAVTATAAGALDTIEMQAPLRQLSRHQLPLTNPLDTDVAFTAACDHSEVSVPAQLVLPASGRAELPIEWRPLLPRDAKSRLTLQSAELGTFLYDLSLVALPAGGDKSLGFKVALGEAQVLRFRFTNFLKKQETYKVTLAGGAGGDFEVDGTVVAPPAEGSAGAEVALEVTYEPSKLGGAQDTLTVSSAEGGEYVCLLRGESLPPKPQGPITIKAGGTATINFKNIFAAATDFLFTCEPPVFTVAKPKENVPSKKPTPVAITYKPTDPAAPPATGKLTIASAAADGSRWTYYLHGTNE